MFEGVVRAIGMWFEIYHMVGQNLVEKKANKLPEWSNACEKALLLQPSSAAFERVLSNSFSNRHEGSLRDYIQTSV